MYRKLNSGQYEVMPYCSPLSEQWLAIYRDDLERIINDSLPKDQAEMVLKKILP